MGQMNQTWMILTSQIMSLYESGFRSDMSIWESDWDSESSWDSDSTETSGVISTTSGSSSSYSSDED